MSLGPSSIDVEAGTIETLNIEAARTQTVGIDIQHGASLNVVITEPHQEVTIDVSQFDDFAVATNTATVEMEVHFSGPPGEEGPPGPSGPQGPPSLYFAYEQLVSSDNWIIDHNLGIFPSVMIVDSGNTVIEPDIIYLNENQVQIQFGSPTSGKAYFS